MRRSVLVAGIITALLVLLSGQAIATEPGSWREGQAYAQFREGPENMHVGLGYYTGVEGGYEFDRFYINLEACDYLVPECWIDTGEVANVRYRINPAGAFVDADVEMRCFGDCDVPLKWVHLTARFEVAHPSTPAVTTRGGPDGPAAIQQWFPEVTSVEFAVTPALIEGMEVPPLVSTNFMIFQSHYVIK